MNWWCDCGGAGWSAALHINVKKCLQFLRDSRKMPDSLRGTDFWFDPVAKHKVPSLAVSAGSESFSGGCSSVG